MSQSRSGGPRGREERQLSAAQRWRRSGPSVTRAGPDVAESDVGVERIVGSMAASLKDSRFGAQERGGWHELPKGRMSGDSGLRVAAGGTWDWWAGAAASREERSQQAGAPSPQPWKRRGADSRQRRGPQRHVDGLAKPRH